MLIHNVKTICNTAKCNVAHTERYGASSSSRRGCSLPSADLPWKIWKLDHLYLDWRGTGLKVAISEFGLWMLMHLLNHYMFIEVMRYLHDNQWFVSQ